MIKAVFFDIDGTLVSFKTHRVPDSTKRAIAILRAKGIRVFIASGRQLLAINNLEDLQFDGYVTLNGGYCIVGEQVIYKHSMPSEDMVSLVRYMEEQESFPCIFVHENALHERTDERDFSFTELPATACPALTRGCRRRGFPVGGIFHERTGESDYGCHTSL